ncbi:uncharacterized protein LOC122831155 [Gambusia affinis]|uniref:uncharacterized protein LOC122831155 n=1 Tax=Gambusia affinis TaxID=33528 RepID=UPI001CDBE66F|nr:uncharacterized protein LOC122831155 [Gambusia affinis]
MSLPTEKTDNAVDMPLRSSSRERKLTEKGQEMHIQENKKREKTFHKVYDSWKWVARESRKKLKALCTLEELNDLQETIQAKYDAVRLQYKPILRNSNTTAEIVKKMEACVTLTKEICDLINNRTETIDKDYNSHLEKERVRETLNKDEYGSIFGHTQTETVSSSKSSEGSSSHSNSSSTNDNKADAQAELAAKVEQSKATKEIQAQAQLQKLENEWKLKESKMLSEMKQKEVEMQQQLDQERAKLQRLKEEKEIAVAAARVRAYDEFERCVSNVKEVEDLNYRTNPVFSRDKPCLNPDATSFQPYQSAPEVTTNPETSNLAEAIASSLSMSRLPVPEPIVFSGDPLRFTDWKMSFMTLIDRKPLPASEKMFYLRNYLAGEARKAVEGFFYHDSESAYIGAWKVLQDRYGNAFIIQKAFRDKLARWPKINANDSLALRGFSDFLQGCKEAIPHVKGLAILNDCEENHTLLKKLPEWIVRKWSRIVVDELDESDPDCRSGSSPEPRQAKARITD